MTGSLEQIQDVWDLSSTQIEELRAFRHMNNYVHAGLVCVHQSRWPREGSWRVQEGLVRPELEAAVNEVLALVGVTASSDDPRRDRIRLTKRVFEMYRELGSPEAEEVPELMRVLASVAFLSLIVDRNDGFPLWWHRPVRVPESMERRVFAFVSKPFDLDAIIREFAKELMGRGAQLGDALSEVFVVTIMIVQAIIVMVENGVFSELASAAYAHTERAIRRFERQHRLDGTPGVKLGTREIGQIRYRNTLYLYGGSLLERMGQHREARAWYLRDIDTPQLPDCLGFYLTAFKTCERLFSALRITAVEHRPPLRELIDAAVHKSLLQTQRYAVEVLEIIDTHPNMDLSQPKQEVAGRSVFFAGEAAREPLLAALLYRRAMEGISYADTDYSLLLTRHTG